MAPTKETLAKLITELTGKPERDALAGYSDEQIDGLIASIAQVLTPDEVFPATSINALAATTASLMDEAEAIIYAATLEPLEVFTGAPGLVVLRAWAVADGYTKA